MVTSNQTANIFKAIAALKQDGGFSYNVNTGELNPTDGYMVAISKESEVRAEHYSKWSPEQIEEMVRQYVFGQAHLLADHDNWFGAWVYADTLFLDVSERFENEEEAKKACQERKELAYYDNAKKETVHV